jgi:hypothetical protein
MLPQAKTFCVSPIYMNSKEIQAYLAEWRLIEDRFYRQILNDADLYMIGIRLVRAVADSLRAIDDLGALVERFQRSSSDDVATIADTLNAPQVVLLDCQLAFGAAFYLRAQEIQQAQAQADFHARLAAARAQGQRWVVLYDQESRRHGHTFFQRLDMRLADGFGLRSASEMDWEKGRVFVLEPLLLDPATGLPRRDLPAPEPPQEFATRAALDLALEALREKYPDSR